MLTRREKDVMRLLICGYNNSEISKNLTISQCTTKAHVSSIYSKLKASNRVQAVVKFIEDKYKIKIEV